jgi:hypothetical protein
MHFQNAALLLQRGLSPQDYEVLAEEYDLLSLGTGLLHDPESAAESAEHLEEVLKDGVVWLPGSVPYGNLWRDLRVGLAAHPVKLCAACYPPRTA